MKPGGLKGSDETGGACGVKWDIPGSMTAACRGKDFVGLGMGA